MARLQGDFARLLRDLRGAGPLDRVRLLGRSLTALRRLSPWDRKVLLRMAGFDGAEMLVERLAGGDSEATHALEGVLTEIEKHPGELQSTVRALADPHRRGTAIDALLARLEAATSQAQAEAEPEAEVEAEAGGAPEPTPAGPPARAAEPWSDPVAAAGRGPEPPLPEAGAPAAPAGEAAPPTPVPPPPVPPAPPAAPRAEEPAEPAAEAPVEEPPAESLAAEPATPEEIAGEPEEIAPPPSPPEPPEPPALLEPPEPPPVERRAAELQEDVARTGLDEHPDPTVASRAPAVRALDSLLDLRRDLDAGPPPPSDEVRRLLDEELPYPWARRRALQAWLEAGGADDVDEALALIDTLPAGADRAWTLATLAGARPWGPEAWERILASASGAGGRRQLELRRRRA